MPYVNIPLFILLRKERSVRGPHDHRNLCGSRLQDAPLLAVTGLAHVDPVQTVVSAFPLWRVRFVYTFIARAQSKRILPAMSCGYSAATAARETTDTACSHRQSCSIYQMTYIYTHNELFYIYSDIFMNVHNLIKKTALKSNMYCTYLITSIIDLYVVSRSDREDVLFYCFVC